MGHELGAIVDLGSNSVRLVIYRQSSQGTQQEIDNLKQTVRLSSHLEKDGRIDEAGIQMALRVLKQFCQLCRAYGVSQVTGIATQAVRVAKNQEEVLRRIYEATGIRFRVVSGEEEARYGYLAVVNSLAVNEGVTVDIGGGSTEITVFRDRKLVRADSIPFGAVSLTRAFLRTDPPSVKDMKSLDRAIQAELDRRPWLSGLGHPVIGMGGTARSLARIHQRRRHYPLQILHGYEMWPTEVTAILDMVRSLPMARRKNINGLSEDRADIITAGLAMLDHILKRVSASQLIISNKGLRDGVLMEQVLRSREQELLPDTLIYSIENVYDQFGLNRAHAYHVWGLADQLLTAMAEAQLIQISDEHRRWLQVAALLHDVGRAVSIYNTSKHTFYLMLQIPLFGISHRDRVMAAAVAAFKSAKQIQTYLSMYQEFFDEEDLPTIAQLGVILRLVRALDRIETGAVTSLDLRPDGRAWKLIAKTKQPLGIELDLALEWTKKCRKVFQREIRLEVDRLDRGQRI